METAWLAEALDRLSDEERAVYGARFVDELDAATASKRLGLSRPTYFRRAAGGDLEGRGRDGR